MTIRLIGKCLCLCLLMAMTSTFAICSVTVFTDRTSWEAAIQSEGYSLVGVSFANPSAWTTSSYSIGAESYNGLTSNQTSNGMSVMIDSAAFGGLTTSVSIQNGSLMDSEQEAHPERDTSYSFGNEIYAFGGDYTVSCPAGTYGACATSTFFLSQPTSSVGTSGPNTSGFWGIVVTPDSGTQQFVQGISACVPSGPNCYFDYSLSGFDVAVATPEPSGLLLLCLGAGMLALSRVFSRTHNLRR